MKARNAIGYRTRNRAFQNLNQGEGEGRNACERGFRYDEIAADRIAAIASMLDAGVDVSGVLEVIPGTGTAGTGTIGYDNKTLLHGGYATIPGPVQGEPGARAVN